MLELVIVSGVVTMALLIIIRDLEGPFDVFFKARIYFTEFIDDKPRFKFMHGLYTCPWCFGTWISLVVSSLLVLSMKQIWYWIPFIWLGGLSVACLLYREV